MVEHDTGPWECAGQASALASSIAEAGGEPVSMDAAERERRIESLAQDVGPLALGVARKMLGDRALAEDALQDAFLQAYRGFGGFRGESSMRTWFLRILVNSCRRHRVVARRWLSRGREAAAEQVHTDAHGDPALRTRLDKAVLALPHRQRTAFVLRYTKDLGIEEIARIMGCAPGTVKATIHKAVMRLRRELGDLMRGET